MKPVYLCTALLMVGSLLLAGCAGMPFLSEPTPTPTATFTPLPTETPLPTPTATLEPTATFTLPPPPTATVPLLPTQPPAPTVAPTVDPDQAIVVYYVNKEEKGQFGCGESLWYIRTNQAKSESVANDMRFALSILLNYHNETFGQLYHAGYASQMAVSDINYNADGQIVVNLTGTWNKTKDPCDGRRFIDQLRQTIKQFPGISGIVIYLNGTPISDALSRK